MENSPERYTVVAMRAGGGYTAVGFRANEGDAIRLAQAVFARVLSRDAGYLGFSPTVHVIPGLPVSLENRIYSLSGSARERTIV